jgi:hypothetical protein
MHIGHVRAAYLYCMNLESVSLCPKDQYGTHQKYTKIRPLTLIDAFLKSRGASFGSFIFDHFWFVQQIGLIMIDTSTSN